MDKNKYYIVEWVDSIGTPAGWVDLTDGYPSELLRVKTIGLVIELTDDVVVLAQSHAPSVGNSVEQAMGVITIPIACITSVSPVNASSCQELA